MSKYGCTVSVEVVKWRLEGDTLWPEVARYWFEPCKGYYGGTE